jgi:hypothetical protein
MLNRIGVSSLAVTLGVALLAATTARQLRASEFDKKTIISFSAPVEISGRILPAGTYVFTTLGENRDIVRVVNRDENRVYATEPFECPVLHHIAPLFFHINIEKDMRILPIQFGEYTLHGDRLV